MVWTVDHSLAFINICKKPARFRAPKKKQKIRVPLRGKARKKLLEEKQGETLLGSWVKYREKGNKGEKVVRWVWMCEYVQEEK